ncbi:MAG: hypothetical protein ACOH1Y_17445 [Propionicimonas sp.]
MPDPDAHPSYPALVLDGLDAFTTGHLTAMPLRDLAPADGYAWVTRKEPVIMTTVFKTAWDALTTTDQQSALIRIAAVTQSTWHPSLVVTEHTSLVRSVTASSDTVVYFTANPAPGGHVFLTVTPSGPA